MFVYIYIYIYIYTVLPDMANEQETQPDDLCSDP